MMEVLELSEKRYANIMLLGRTGVGKSSFINYLVGKEVSKTGIGMPVTQGFNAYEFSDVSGVPLRIFDSKGLEVMDYDKIRRDIFSFVQKCCGSEDVYDWIHSIFYCINVNSSRVEPEEIDFIKKCGEKVSQTVHIIMTHCETNAEGREKSAAMVNHVKLQLKDERIRIYCVNSVETKTRVSTTSTFGRQEVLDKVFEMLWSDMANRVAKKYAKELHEGLEKIVCNTIFKPLDNVIDEINNIDLILDIISDRDDTMNRIENIIDDGIEELDEMEELIKEKCHESIMPLIEFCNEYGNSMGYEIELYDPFDFLPSSFCDFDSDKMLEKSNLSKIIKELENIEDEKGIQGAIKAGKTIKVLLSMKKLIKDCFECIKSEFYQSIPDCRELEKSIYDSLMMGFYQ